MIGKISVGDYKTWLYTNYTVKLWASCFQRRFLKVFPIINDPRGVTSLNPRAMVGRFYVGALDIAIYCKYKLCQGLMILGRFFLSFSHHKSMGSI